MILPTTILLWYALSYHVRKEIHRPIDEVKLLLNMVTILFSSITVLTTLSNLLCLLITGEYVNWELLFYNLKPLI